MRTTTMRPWNQTLGPRSLFGDFDSVFDAFMNDWPMATTETPRFHPKVDVMEKEDFYLISADLPGMSKDDINIEVNDGVLTLSGERQHSTSEEEEGFRRYERSYGQFERRFQLPDKVDADKIQARHENGVLEILIPKVEVEKGKTINIEPGKGGLFSKLLGKGESHKGTTEKKQ